MTEFNGIPCLNSTEMKARLGFGIAAPDIEALGFRPHAFQGAGKYWRLDQLNQIIESIKTRLDLAKVPV